MEECKDFSRELSNDSAIFNLHSQPYKHIDKEVKKLNECDLNRQSSEVIDLNELSDKNYSNLIDDSPKMYNQHHDLFSQKPRTSRPDKAHYSDGEINIADNLFCQNENIFDKPKPNLNQLMSQEYCSQHCMFCCKNKENSQKIVKK